MQSLLSYTQPFEEICGVRFIKMRILDIVEDTESFDFLAAYSIVTYICYILVDKMKMKRRMCSCSLRSRARKLQLQKPFPSRPLMTPTAPYLLSRISFSLLMPRTCLSRTAANLPFHGNPFHKLVRALFDEPHVRHVEQSKESFPILGLFFGTTIQRMKNIFHSIISIFMRNRRTFDYDAKDRVKK